METAMRRLALSIIFAGCLIPPTALAGTAQTSFTTSQEKGVTVYRGQASQHNFNVLAAQQQSRHQRAEQAKVKTRLSVLERKAAEQQRNIDALQAQQVQNMTAATSKRRSRYGRSFIGNNRFFGRNGFIGNSNFAGATQALPRTKRRNIQRKSRGAKRS